MTTGRVIDISLHVLRPDMSGPPDLVQNGGFLSGLVWVLGTGWTIVGGLAVRVAGLAVSAVSQPVALVAGATYRVRYTVVRVAGSVTPQLTGGVTVSGSVRTSSGTFEDDLVAVSGNTSLSFSASALASLTITNVSLVRIA